MNIFLSLLKNILIYISIFILKLSNRYSIHLPSRSTNLKKKSSLEENKTLELKHSALHRIPLLHTILTDTPEVERGRRIPVPPDKYLSPGSPLFSSLPRFTSLNSIHSAPSRSRKSSRGRANFPTTLFHPRHEIYNAVRRAFAFTPPRPEGKTEKGEGAPRSAGPLK